MTGSGKSVGRHASGAQAGTLVWGRRPRRFPTGAGGDWDAGKGCLELGRWSSGRAGRLVGASPGTASGAGTLLWNGLLMGVLLTNTCWWLSFQLSSPFRDLVYPQIPQSQAFPDTVLGFFPILFAGPRPSLSRNAADRRPCRHCPLASPLSPGSVPWLPGSPAFIIYWFQCNLQTPNERIEPNEQLPFPTCPRCTYPRRTDSTLQWKASHVLQLIRCGDLPSISCCQRIVIVSLRAWRLRAERCPIDPHLLFQLTTPRDNRPPPGSLEPMSINSVRHWSRTP
jgi:hypothetical protein